MTPERLSVAGFVVPDGSDGWNEEQWACAARALDLVAHTCRERYGMRVAFHHHAGTYVETPEETDRLMEMTDPELVGLCFDTGHYLYGGGDVLEVTHKYADRIWYVHLKDVWPEKLEWVRRERINMRQAWAKDVFAELGQGCVDFPGFVEILRSVGYQGWIVVEQDVVRDPSWETAWSPLESAIRSRTYMQDVLGI